jgi:hypothetical protein
MKKIIAISVMFALFAGAVFAETAIGGTLETRFNFLSGSTVDGAKPKTTGSVADAYLQVTGANDDGTLSALMRITQNGAAHRAFINWKPIQQLNVFLGRDNDGKFSTGDPLTDWAFHKGSQGFHFVHDWGFWRTVFPGHWDSFGLALSIYPIDGFEFNVIIPTAGTTWRVEDMYIGGLRLQFNYAIEGLGKLFFAYTGGNTVDAVYIDDYSGYKIDPKWAPTYGGGATGEATEKHKSYTNGQVGASFLITAVEGLSIQPGVSFILPNSSNDAMEGAKMPIYAGLGAHYTGDGFGVNARGAYVMNMGFDENASYFTFNAMPWYAISDNLTAYVDIGIAQWMYKGGDAVSGFWTTPSLKLAIPSGSFRIGLTVTKNVELGNTHGGPYDGGPVMLDKMYYTVPMSLVFSF